MKLLANFRFYLVGFLAIFYSSSSFSVIPYQSIKGIDELFTEQHKVYSPILGLIYHGDFIRNSYQLPDRSPLISALFTEVPGGEVLSTHQPKNPAAHLSGGILAKIFVEFEKLRSKELARDDFELQFGRRIVSIITSDEDYQLSLSRAAEDRAKATQEYEDLEQRYQNQQHQVLHLEKRKQNEVVPLNRKIKKTKETIQILEASGIDGALQNVRAEAASLGLDATLLNRMMAKLKASIASKKTEQQQKVFSEFDQEISKLGLSRDTLPGLTSALDQLRTSEKKPSDSALAEIKKLEEYLETLEVERTRLNEEIQAQRGQLIDAEARKLAERKLTYELEFHDTTSQQYTEALVDLGKTIAASFATHEMKNHSTPTSQYATSIALLSYLWMKYSQKADLRSYLETLAQAGFLEAKKWKKKSDRFYEEYYDEKSLRELKSNFLNSWHKEDWISEHYSALIALSMLPNSDVKLPQVVSFGYFKWMKYSRDPDCCENALHNLLNLIAFNPETGLFDETILQRLKEKYYPGLSDKLIGYYHENKTFEEHDKVPAAASWITVVSGLNDGFENLDKSQKIHYRKHRTIVASPYSNLLKVVNRLFGYADVNQDHMAEILARVKEISGFEITYDKTKVDSESFGTAEFKVGSIRYQLQAHRPIHVGFRLEQDKTDQVLVKAGKLLGKSVRKEKDEIKKLRYHSSLGLLSGRGIPLEEPVGIEQNEQALFAHH